MARQTLARFRPQRLASGDQAMQEMFGFQRCGSGYADSMWGREPTAPNERARSGHVRSESYNAKEYFLGDGVIGSTGLSCWPGSDGTTNLRRRCAGQTVGVVSSGPDRSSSAECGVTKQLAVSPNFVRGSSLSCAREDNPHLWLGDRDTSCQLGWKRVECRCS